MVNKFYNYTCCFTGHRELPKDENELRIIRSRTRETIDMLIKEKSVKYFGVGGALGYDTMAAKILFNFRDSGFSEYKDIKIILIAPFIGYTSRWSQEQKEEAEQLRKKYDKIVFTSNIPSKAAYLERDRHLVNQSKFIITYLVKQSGGTAYTVDYARKQGNHVIINVANNNNLELLMKVN